MCDEPRLDKPKTSSRTTLLIFVTFAAWRSGWRLLPREETAISAAAPFAAMRLPHFPVPNGS